MTEAADAPLVQRIRVLDANECRAVDTAVHELHTHWVRRDAAAFHTLGAALYLDQPREETLERFGVPHPPAGQYSALSAVTNPLLERHFSALYGALARALASLLGAEVEYAAGRALPGFHIFQHAAIYARQTAHVPHFDRQYECIAWPDADRIDFNAAISVTLPIRLPARGGGLRVWDLNLFEVQATTPDVARARAATAQSHTHAYAPGELVCHRGHLLHQIVPWVSQPDDERITLQGHGLYFGGAWQLYW